MNIINLTGQVFGSLTVLRRAGSDHHRSEASWLCRCVCGAEKVIRSDKLRDGRTKSCGCLNATKHGMSASPEYNAWKSLTGRCLNPKHPNYRNYGGRGIQVSFGSFEDFYADIGPKPSPELTVDRIDNEGHYGPGNVHWATRADQMKNRRIAP